MMRLVLVGMAGQTPLRPRSPVHWPPSFGPCSKIVGSNPCETSQRAAIKPPGPAPITATVLVIGELSRGWDRGAISLTVRRRSGDGTRHRRLHSRTQHRQSAVVIRTRAVDALDAVTARERNRR